jgi:hypothetical protein
MLSQVPQLLLWLGTACLFGLWAWYRSDGYPPRTCAEWLVPAVLLIFAGACLAGLVWLVTRPGPG